jgi:hypothetical protein
MRKFITLRTNDGRRVYVSLDSWGGGTDRFHRRWTRDYDGWRCVDNGEIARQSGLLFPRTFRPLGFRRG